MKRVKHSLLFFIVILALISGSLLYILEKNSSSFSLTQIRKSSLEKTNFLSSDIQAAVVTPTPAITVSSAPILTASTRLPTNTPVQILSPTPTSGPTATPRPLASGTITLTPPGSSITPQAQGNVGVQILENGYIFSAKVQGNINKLSPNSDYYIYLCRNDGNCNVMSQSGGEKMTTDQLGTVSFTGYTTTRNGGDKIKSVTIFIAQPDTATNPSCKYPTVSCLVGNYTMPQ